MTLFFKHNAKDPSDVSATTLTKTLSVLCTAGLLNVMSLPAQAAVANERAQEAAQQNTLAGDTAYDKLVNLTAKYELQEQSYQTEREAALAGRNIFSRTIDGITSLFTDNTQVIEQIDPEVLEQTTKQVVALKDQLQADQRTLIAQLSTQTKQMQQAGFDKQAFLDHRDLILEMDKRHQTVMGLIANVESASNEAEALTTLTQLNAQLNEWQPKQQQTDVENLPWGMPDSDVREPIMTEADAVVLQKASMSATPTTLAPRTQQYLTQPYSALQQSAIGEWRNTEYRFGQLLMQQAGFGGDFIKTNGLAGKTDAGQWTVLNALPIEVQPADLTETPDVQITPAIQTLADELNNNPAEIYAWVHDNIEYIPTYGSIQGSDYTLQTKRGNAFDTASLLIALLRASDIPARYVYGTVDIPAKQAMDWIGGVNNIDAAQNLLGQGGVPNRALMNGSEPAFLRMEHVWVEANINAISRGVANNDNQTQWLPLDASYKSYTRTQGIDLETAVPFDAEALIEQAQQGATIDDNTGSVQNLNQGAVNQAIEDYQARVQEYLEQNHPDATVGDVLGTSTINPYKSEMLSPVLPYQVRTVVSDYQELPEGMRHYLLFNLYENVGFLGQNSYGLPLYEYKIPTVKLQGKPLSFSFHPENDTEKQKLINSVINSEGQSISNSLPINIWMSPELRLGDETLKNLGRFRLGYDMKVRYGIQSPNSTLPSLVNKEIVAGEYHAIGYNLQGISEEQLQQTKNTLQLSQNKIYAENSIEDLNQHDTTGAILQATVQSYFAINQKQDAILANQANIIDNFHLSFGTVSSTLNTDYRYGLPWRTRPSGVTVDMDRLRHQIVSKDNKQIEQTNYLQAQGIRESSNENLIPEELLGDNVQGISAVKALKLATEEGQRIFVITNENQTEVLPKLSAHSARTLADITNALNAGLQVTVSERPVKLNSWVGSGYIIQDTLKGTGAYMLEGGINGGFAELLDIVDDLGNTTDGKSRSMSLAISGMLTAWYEVTAQFLPSIIMEMMISTLSNSLSSATEIYECHKDMVENIIMVSLLAMSMYAIYRYNPFPAGRIIGLGGVGATLIMYPMMAQAAKKRNDCLNRGRIQAQGEKLEESVAWARETPPTMEEGLAMLEELKDKLPKKELEIREEAFIRTQKFITQCRVTKGCDAVVIKSFDVKNTKSERVDMEIRTGKAFQ